ncbi:hypothetical protein F5X68DRAFT_173908 [Plectosphaerella plurivora]|uniref:FAD/NAD(P)-binding domain-containing protein n=1 Tax=Plectosphaerella plurivora TaxID=936078 RepID=A0A9P9A8I0_9PEZI|nr:hypothetical protein F5X68DRAFT_173908 [Plectosphaerella plurivora]
MTTATESNVVILGAGYAGIGIAHKLLKHTWKKSPSFRVVLVSPSTHHFWNLASVRGLVPGEIPDGDMFRDIQSGFAKYPQDAFAFIVGTASGMDTSTSTVRVTTAAGTQTLHYAHLVIATGSSYPSRIPFGIIGSYEETLDSWHSLQDSVKAAKSIIIAGSGAAGVEAAAELGCAYGQTKQITLVMESELPLTGLFPKVRQAAADALESLGVRLVPKARVATSSTSQQGTLVMLSTGDTLEADLYLPFFGMRPNTQFVPSEFLDPGGSIKLNRTLRVTGSANVWGVGDAGNLERKQLVFAEKQALRLARNLHCVLTSTEHRMGELDVDDGLKMFVTLGKKRGTGQWFGFKMPSVIVSMSKGKKFFAEKGDGLVAGKNIVRSSV